jgi:acyl carrier protein
VAYLIVNQHSVPSLNQVRTFMGARVPEHMIPSAFVMLEALPLNSNGKVDRKALPKPEGPGLELETPYASPQTELEEVIAGMVKEVLNIEKVGLRHNFFELGGNSIDMIQLHTKLRERLKKDFPLITLFQNPTVTALSEYFSHEELGASSLQQSYDRGVRRKELALQRQRSRNKN